MTDQLPTDPTPQTPVLLPCPNSWCGGKLSAVVSNHGSDDDPEFFAECLCGVTGPSALTEAEAAAAWNRRAPVATHATLTTPATAGQLREDAAVIREDVESGMFHPSTGERHLRAAVALDAEAARMEAKTWPRSDAVTRLVRAARHLMLDHDCDHDSHEEVMHAIAAVEAPAHPHAELRGWGVMRPDGTLVHTVFPSTGDGWVLEDQQRHVDIMYGDTCRAVKVRLTTEGADADV
jgi:Lar family restriction alleviation protein